jgi:hypothetical protein
MLPKLSASREVGVERLSRSGESWICFTFVDHDGVRYSDHS